MSSEENLKVHGHELFGSCAAQCKLAIQLPWWDSTMVSSRSSDGIHPCCTTRWISIYSRTSTQPSIRECSNTRACCFCWRESICIVLSVIKSRFLNRVKVCCWKFSADLL
ncbi:hypothetical protein OIU74_026816 [Salix koriyanagi]|uniref:Uncharacterized protein n=1 Tax=Salix koriyanagi TaxID=2511006 RepID=A0A9Q0VZH4_9ROSI|nr:hypothetical protein OIU74_026816 [Salix koriyanagi]